MIACFHWSLHQTQARPLPLAEQRLGGGGSRRAEFHLQLLALPWRNPVHGAPRSPGEGGSKAEMSSWSGWGRCCEPGSFTGMYSLWSRAPPALHPISQLAFSSAWKEGLGAEKMGGGKMARKGLLAALLRSGFWVRPYITNNQYG